MLINSSSIGSIKAVTAVVESKLAINCPISLLNGLIINTSLERVSIETAIIASKIRYEFYIETTNRWSIEVTWKVAQWKVDSWTRTLK